MQDVALGHLDLGQAAAGRAPPRARGCRRRSPAPGPARWRRWHGARPRSAARGARAGRRSRRASARGRGSARRRTPRGRGRERRWWSRCRRRRCRGRPAATCRARRRRTARAARATACCCNAGETASSASQRSVARTQPASSETARAGPDGDLGRSAADVDDGDLALDRRPSGQYAQPRQPRLLLARVAGGPRSPFPPAAASRNSPPLAESRTALVAVARRTCAPCESAISR